MGDRNWQGGAVLAAKIDPARPILAAERFFRYRSLAVFKFQIPGKFIPRNLLTKGNPRNF